MARSSMSCADRDKRAQPMLLAAEGSEVQEVVVGFCLYAWTARFWLNRFDAHGPCEFAEGDRPSRPPVHSMEQVEAVI
jgi:hypothetical protein